MMDPMTARAVLAEAAAHGPLSYLLADLRMAQRRGASFCDAWPRALHWALRTVYDEAGRRAWEIALRETRGPWESAYNREPPTAGDLAVVLLAEGRGGVFFEPDVPGCPECGAVVPLERGGRARYCGEACRRATARRRRIAQASA